MIISRCSWLPLSAYAPSCRLHRTWRRPSFQSHCLCHAYIPSNMFPFAQCRLGMPVKRNASNWITASQIIALDQVTQIIFNSKLPNLSKQVPSHQGTTFSHCQAAPIRNITATPGIRHWHDNMIIKYTHPLTLTSISTAACEPGPFPSLHVVTRFIAYPTESKRHVKKIEYDNLASKVACFPPSLVRIWSGAWYRKNNTTSHIGRSAPRRLYTKAIICQVRIQVCHAKRRCTKWPDLFVAAVDLFS